MLLAKDNSKYVQSCTFLNCVFLTNWQSPGNSTFGFSQNQRVRCQKSLQPAGWLSFWGHTPLQGECHHGHLRAKPHIKWELTSKNLSQWRLESEPSWAPCVGSMGHSRKRRASKPAPGPNSTETPTAKSMVSLHRAPGLFHGCRY